jgi:hypothetical protein
MAGLEDFAHRIREVAVRVEGRVGEAVRECAVDVATSVIEETPVDTGRARSNWIVRIDAPAVGTSSARVPGSAGSTADANTRAAIEAASGVIRQFDVGKNQSIHVTNNLAYMGRLNSGHSRQAPVGFVMIAVLAGLRRLRKASLL